MSLSTLFGLFIAVGVLYQLAILFIACWYQGYATCKSITSSITTRLYKGGLSKLRVITITGGTWLICHTV